MTPDQRAVLAVREAGGYTDEVPVIAEAIRAALRERDAEHEAALKKALDACECDACYGISPVECDAEKMASRLRALLEEAGK